MMTRKERRRRRRQVRIAGRRSVEGPTGPVAVRLVRPGKESNWRWTALAAGFPGLAATGDTTEEACDNLGETVRRRA